MGSGFDATYTPQTDRVGYYNEKYAHYLTLGEAAEKLARS